MDRLQIWTVSPEKVSDSDHLLKRLQVYLDHISPNSTHSNGGIIILPPYFFMPEQAEQMPHQQLDLLKEQLGELARKYNVYLVPGSWHISVNNSNASQHTSFLFSPEGKEIGQAGQTHLSQEERKKGIIAADDLPVFETEFGRMAILLQTDCWIPEVWRIATLKGAKLIVCLTAEKEPYSKWHQLAGPWQNTQQNQVYTLECGLEGRFRGEEYQARSVLFAPCEITAGETGIIELAKIKLEGEKAGLMTSEINFNDLHKAREQYQLLAHFNVPLYQQWLPKIYSREIDMSDEDGGEDK